MASQGQFQEWIRVIENQLFAAVFKSTVEAHNSFMLFTTIQNI